MATQRKVEFQGTFNIQEILSAVDALQNRLNRIQLDDSSARRFERTFADLKKRAQEIDAEIKQGFTNTSQINNFNNHLQKLGQQMEILKGEIGRIDTSFSNLQLSPNLQKQFENLKNSANTMFDAYKNQISSIENKISSFANKTGVSFDQTEISGLAEAISSSEKLAKLQEEKQASLLQEKADIQATISAREESLKQAEQEVILARQNQEMIAAQYVSQKEKVTAMRGEGVDAASLQKQVDIQKDLNAKNNEAREVVLRKEKAQKKIVEDLESEQAELTKIESSLSNITKFFNGLKGDSSGLDDDAAAAAKEFADLSGKVALLEKQLEAANAELQKFKDLQAKKATSGIDKSADDIGRLKDNIDNASNSASGLSDNLVSLSKRDQFFDNLKNRATAVFGLTNAFIYMNRFIRESVNAIKELDAAFTEIAVVTDMTTTQLWESFDTYNEMAQKLGTTTVDAIQTSALYYQQGLDTVEVLQLTEETMKMARIAGMDYAEATDRMTAALRGFKLEMSEATRVNDVFSALAAESAVDTDELSYALTKTASIAASAGMELETTSAFLSQMIETTREAPENIGTAMKTIIARFQELKSSVGDSVEIDGELVDVNKVDTALKSVGVQLRDSLTGQFRDLDDVFLELASKWDTLDRNTQRYVATIAAGSRQQSRFIAMMDNYERTLELVDIAQNSNGASAAQFAKTLDSLEAKMNNIKSSFEEFIGTVVGSELVKNILDGVNTILQMINDIAEAGPAAIAVFGTFFIMTIKKIISNFINTAKVASTAFTTAWTTVSGNYSTKMKDANQQAVVDLENKIRNSIMDKILADKIKNGVNAGVNSANTGNTNFQNGGNSNSNIDLNDILKRSRDPKQKVTKTERQTLSKMGIKSFGVSDDVLAKNIESYQQQNNLLQKTNTGLSGFMKKIGNLNPLIGQTIASFANIGTMAIMGNAATKGTAALSGATTGNMVGSLVGSLGYLIPRAGMALGPIFQALGGTLGAFLGEGIGEGLDNQKYGIGSESSIKNFEEQAKRISKKTSQIIEENNAVIDSASQYEELNSKINLTNEEKDQLLELNNSLLEQFPDLSTAYNSEIKTYTLQNELLREKIRLKKQENAIAATSSQIAETFLKVAEQTRQNIDSQKEVEKTLGTYGSLVLSASTLGNSAKDLEKAKQQFSDLSEEIKDSYSQLEKLSQFSYNEIQTPAGSAASKSIASARIDLTDMSIEELEQYKEALVDFGTAAGETDIAEKLDLYIETLKNGKEAIKEQLEEINSTVGDSLNAVLSGRDSSSFSSQNRSIISSMMKSAVDTEDLLNSTFMDPEELSKKIEEDRQKIGNAMADSLDKLTKEQQIAFSNSLNFIGFFGSKEEDFAQMSAYLERTIGAAGVALAKQLEQYLPEEEYDKLKSKYDKINNLQEEYIQKLKEGGKQVEAATYANIAAQLGKDAPNYIKAFQQAYDEILEKYSKIPAFNISDLENKRGGKLVDSLSYANANNKSSQIIAAIGKTNITSGMSVANLEIQLKKLGVTQKEINNLISSMGSVFNRSGLTASEALTNVTSGLETVNGLIEMIEGNSSGLSISQFAKLNELLDEAGEKLLTINDIQLTAGGIQIKGGVDNIVGNQVKFISQQYQNMAKQAAQSIKYNERMKESYSSTAATAEAALKTLVPGSQEYKETLGKRNVALSQISSIEEQIGDASQAQTLYELSAAKMLYDQDVARTKSLQDKIKAYKALVAELDRYYNLTRQMLALTNEYSRLELDLDLAQNGNEAGQIFKSQLENLLKQQELLKVTSEQYQSDLSKMSAEINSQYGEYLSVGKDGIIATNTDNFEKLANRMKNASDQQREALQNEYDTIMDVKEQYEKLYDLEQDASIQQKKNLQEQRDLQQQMVKNIANLQVSIRNIILAEMKREVEETKKKYNKIKQEDQKYLNSLQQNINKRKQMQQDENQDKEIDTLQKRIGLLSRDTSGIYAKELEDLQAELDTKLQEKSNTALDRLYEQEQQKTQMVADELTLRSEYLQSQLDLELETYEISNQRVAELLQQKDTEILGWMTKHSEEFRRATEEEQQGFVTTWEQQITLAKGSQDGLSVNLDENRVKIKDMYNDIKVGGIDVYLDAVRTANKTPLTPTWDLSKYKQGLDQMESMNNDFYKRESQKQLDDLIKQYMDAVLNNDVATQNAIKTQYEVTLSQYKKYNQGSTGAENSAYEGMSYKGNQTFKDYSAGLEMAKDLGDKSKSEQDAAKNAQEAEQDEISAQLSKIQYNKEIELHNSQKDILSYDSSGRSNGIAQARGENDVNAYMINGSAIARIKPGEDKYSYFVKTNTTGDSYIDISDMYYAQIGNPGVSTNVGNNLTKIKKKVYATGGMVDYTGPAWVDGTKTKPEAFLSAADTANIAKLRDILSKVFDSPKSSSNDSPQNQNSGDTYYEFHITVDELGEGYDAKDMMADMEKYIIQKSNYRNVINIGKKK